MKREVSPHNVDREFPLQLVHTPGAEVTARSYVVRKYFQRYHRLSHVLIRWSLSPLNHNHHVVYLIRRMAAYTQQLLATRIPVRVTDNAQRRRARPRSLHYCEQLAEAISRHQFKIPIQGAISGTIIAVNDSALP